MGGRKLIEKASSSPESIEKISTDNPMCNLISLALTSLSGAKGTICPFILSRAPMFLSSMSH